MIIREEWIEPYRRVVIVEEGGRRFYSIDFYMEWRDEAPRGLERVAGVAVRRFGGCHWMRGVRPSSS
ncbi:hypothetical protein [Aeropyrum camini]|uniref:hypothetical protein n=1 Tax=Aeropyrum camini TaxID=229980 RepID=UPI000787A9BF|nr:hypothetical protein [Aeropyrum camini]